LIEAVQENERRVRDGMRGIGRIHYIERQVRML
jgi:hypothetical protein